MPDSRPAPRAEVGAERDAHAACARLAASHYENFPVRGPFLRPAERRDLAAVYAFCRTTDDLGDEAEGDRLGLLATWREEVSDALAGRPPPAVPILAAVSRAATRRDLEPELFHRVIEANVRDQTVRAYPDRAALLEYCSHSATPVGRMVLGVAGVRDPDLARLSDHTCIGLQLANFWQDLARDRDQDRCYLPLDDCSRHGVDPEADLSAGTAGGGLRALLADEVAWARDHLRAGWPLADRLPIRWRPLVRAFTRGGWAVCDAIERQDFDTLARRPTLSRRERTRLLFAEWARAWRAEVPLPGPPSA